MIANLATQTVEAIYVALGDTLVDEDGATMLVAALELYGAEVAVYGPACCGLRGERYLFARDEVIRVVARPFLNREG
jgi:hypothetical protein